MNNNIDIEKFMNSISACPDENRQEGTVPIYDANSGQSFNEVFVRLYKNRVKGCDVFVPDGNWGEWRLVPVKDVWMLQYTSCSGSEVTIQRQRTGFVVTHTKNVGFNTAQRLIDAGYTGLINRAERRKYYYPPYTGETPKEIPEGEYVMP